MNLLNSKLATKFQFFIFLSTFFALIIPVLYFAFYYLATGKYPSLALFIGIGFVASTAGSFLTGFLFSKYTLKPISEIQNTIRQLTFGDLNIKLDIKTHDEFQLMSEELNSLARKFEVDNKKMELDKYMLWTEHNKATVTYSSIADGVIGLDSNQKVLLFNRAAEIILGINAKDIISKDIHPFIQIIDDNKKEVLPAVYCPTTRNDFEGVAWTGRNITLKTFQGKEIPADITSSKIKESVRANLGCILTIHDLTKEKQLEEMKLDFVSMAAHELRTPITSIVGYLSVFMDEMKGKIPPSQAELLDKIEFASKQLQSLVDNMLNVSRIERGVFSVTVAPMDYLDLMDKIFSEVKERAKSKSQTLEYTPPTTPLPQMEGDKIRLGEVISNLIGNAINYTPAGGHIKVSVELKEGQIITHITDNGRGIPPEAISRLFQKFYRVVSKLEQSSKGNGLGLYISKAIVEVHHGKIWVESELGKGSTFSFSLPTKQFQYQTFSQKDLGLAKP